MIKEIISGCGVMPFGLAAVLICIAALGIICVPVYKLKKTKPYTEQNGYLPVLDGLRSVCAILIFMFHNWQQTWLSAKFDIFGFTLNLQPFQQYGYIAVDAFFVMSGFCLFYPVAREMFNESGKQSVSLFYIKRARRIIPAYYFMLILLIIFPVLSYNTYNASDIGDIIKHFGLHALFLHIYNAETLGSCISTAWTLGIEVAFYAVFPFVAKFFKKKPAFAFGCMFLLSQTLRILTLASGEINMLSTSNPLLYLDIFGVGMLSAYFTVYIRNKLKNILSLKYIMTVISILCLVGIYYYMLWMGNANVNGLDSSACHRLLYRILLSSLFALFILSASYSAKIWQKFWGNKLFVFISGISYSFYLWHQNIHIALRKLNIPYTSQNPVTLDKQAMVIFMILSIVLSVSIAIFSTYCIEKPIVRYGFCGYFKLIKEKINKIFGLRA